MSRERNVVVLGKVGSGKKTLVNHILGADIFQPGSAVGARNVGVHWTGEQQKGDTIYRILTVDTGGIQTVFSNPLPFIERYFQTINLIIFVIANGRYTDESHSSLVQAVGSLHQGTKQFSALVITHCEDLTDVERKAIVDEFMHDARTYQVTALMGKGTYAVGFPNPSKQALKVLYESGIAEDEKNVRKLVNDSKNILDVKHLQVQVVQPPKKQRSVDSGPSPYYAGVQHLPVQVVQPPKKQRSVDSGPSPYYVGVQPLNDSQRSTPTTQYYQKQELFRAQRDSQQKEVPTANLLNLDTDDLPPRADPVPQSTTRTIIMLGTTGAGKKTLGKRIAGKDIFKDESTVGYGRFSIGETLYQIQTVDTENVYSGQNSPLPLIQRFDAVHLIIFVIAYGKYTDESQRQLIHVVQNLRPKAVPISALLITHCEGITDEDRRNIISEFRTDPATIPLAAFMGKSIYTVGFPEPSQPFVKEVLEEEITKDELVVKKLVKECQFSVPVKDIPVQQPVPLEWHSPTSAIERAMQHSTCSVQ